MNIQSATSLRQPMTPLPMFFPDDLITEVLSFLTVKSLMRFRCVSKSWNTLISDPAFVKLHLKRSARNAHFTLVTQHITFIPGESEYGSDDDQEEDVSVVPFPIRRLIDNPSFTLTIDPYYLSKDKGSSRIAGFCNGLICLVGVSDTYGEYWLYFWNPAMKTISEKLGYFCDFGDNPSEPFRFTFGYDNSTGTYKVVATRYIRAQVTSEVRILSLDGDYVWRNIQSFPVIPLHLDYRDNDVYGGVYLSGTLNWLAIHNNIRYAWYDVKNFTVDQFVIVSLDLGTETYNQFQLPRGFDEVPPNGPTIGMLAGCLCFSYSYKETDFVIWQMKKFGVEESWAQFLKISYQNLQLNYDFSNRGIKYHFQLLPLHLSEDHDTLILYSNQEEQAILYNWRDNRVERTNITVNRTIITENTSDYIWWSFAKDLKAWFRFVEKIIKDEKKLIIRGREKHKRGNQYLGCRVMLLLIGRTHILKSSMLQGVKQSSTITQITDVFDDGNAAWRHTVFVKLQMSYLLVLGDTCYGFEGIFYWLLV